MGNTEGVVLSKQESEDIADNAENIKKTSKNPCDKYSGIFVDIDREEMQRLLSSANRQDAEKIIHNKTRVEEFRALDSSRRKDEHPSVDPHCDNNTCKSSPSSTTDLELRESKEAVGNQLHQLVVELYPKHAVKIVEILLETSSLNVLMGQPGLLRKKVDQAAAGVVSNTEESQSTAEAKAQQSDPEEKDQLGEELDYEHLRNLTNDPVLLKDKVKEAVSVLESTSAPSCQTQVLSDTAERQGLEDKVYQMVAKLYPESPDKVTGMLLEMDMQDLLVLVEREEFLRERAQEAYDALNGATQGVKQKHQSSLDLKKKENLGEELYEIVEKVHPKYADRITGMLMEMDCADLDTLMKNPELRKEKVQQAFEALNNTADTAKSASLVTEKQTIGEQLYKIVEHVQPKHADKITGMLLEMSDEDLKALMENHAVLKGKVQQAFEVLNSNGESICPEVDEKQTLGEQFYTLIEKDHPEQADVITGMLLEMDLGSLEQLVKNPELLREKIQVAVSVLSKSQSHNEEGLPMTRQSDDQLTIEELGEKLYLQVEQTHPDNADRITGTLLELGKQNVQNILNNPEQLQEKIALADEALK